MAGSAAIVRDLFRAPGDPSAPVGKILRQAAVAYQGFLHLASNGDGPISYAPLAEAIDRLGQRKYRWLCHPLLIEGLHAACAGPAIRRWHQSVATPGVSSVLGPAGNRGPLLGNISLALRLRENPLWSGAESLATDLTGRIRFPGSDWSIVVFDTRTEQPSVVVCEPVTIRMQDNLARLSFDDCDNPFLSLPREKVLSMTHNEEELQLQGIKPDAELRVRMQFATPLCSGGVRYDPILFTNFEAHAGYTGAIVDCVLEAMRAGSPAIHREFSHLMHAVRGFELPESAAGTVGSFSDPAHPRIMGINVPYTLDHEPMLDPFCFQWFGHELAHTKNYLINDLAYFNGWTFLENPTDSIPCSPRYARSLSMRTVFQIPYTHFYEWTLLMDFMERGFDALPWDVSAEPAPVGDDLEAEISESFDLISKYGHLTRLGTVAVSHLWQLFRSVRARWRSVRGRWHAWSK